MINPFVALAENVSTNIKYRKQSISMAHGVLKKQYGGTLLGWVWDIIHVAVWIALYWFGISVGIRGRAPVTLPDGTQVSYLIWMLPGVIAWFFYRDCWSSGVSAIRNESHLVTRIVFPVVTIPVFHVMSYMATHLVVILIIMGIYIFSGQGLSIYFIQMLYYVPLFFIFCCVVTTFLSTIGALSKDFLNLVKSFTIAFFWLTPVLWNIDRLKTTTGQMIIKLNPYYYFVQGYRDSFMGQAWFFEHQWHTLYFFAFTIVFALITAVLQKKLSPEFADVL